MRSGGCVGDLFGARGVVWDHTGVTVLDLPGGGADGINASGQVVGIRLGATRPILWDNGIPIDLSTVGAPEGFVPSALNARGQVVGSRYVGSPSGADALLWHNGTTVDLGTAPGEVTQAWDINASGEVVGDSHLLGSGEVRARLWTRKRN